MPHPYWPLFDLEVRTPSVTLRLPTDDELLELLDVVQGGVHDPAIMPFSIPWTDAESPERERESLKHWWRSRANWSHNDWHLTMAVHVEGEIVGVQDVFAKDFAQLRVADTGSWIGQRFQGQGIGKEMRSAILHLIFEGLHAVRATSGAFVDNPASIGVSKSLGYRKNGIDWFVRKGERVEQVRFALDRADWEPRRRDDIEIVGLDDCLEMFFED